MNENTTHQNLWDATKILLKNKLIAVAHICNLSRDQEDRSLRPPQAKSSQDPISTNG
jgi:hypothetical protein